MRRRLFAYAVAPLAMLGLLGTGCGGGDDKKEPAGSSGAPASGDAASILSSIKPVTQQGPQKIGLKLAVNLNGQLKDPTVGALLGSGPISLDLSGPVDSTGKAADLTFKAVAGKINLAGGLRLAGDKAFLSLNDKWYELPADALATGTTGSENIDPAKILEALGNPSDLVSNAKAVGSEDIEGIATDHVTGDINTSKLVEAIARVAQSVGGASPIDPKEIEEATSQLEKFVKNAKVEVWVGKEDKQVHQFKLDLDATLDEATKASSGLDGFGMSMTISSTPTDSPKVETPSGAGTVADLQRDIGPIILSGLGGAAPTP